MQKKVTQGFTPRILFLHLFFSAESRAEGQIKVIRAAVKNERKVTSAAAARQRQKIIRSRREIPARISCLISLNGLDKNSYCLRMSSFESKYFK